MEGRRQTDMRETQPSRSFLPLLMFVSYGWSRVALSLRRLASGRSCCTLQEFCSDGRLVPASEEKRKRRRRSFLDLAPPQDKCRPIARRGRAYYDKCVNSGPLSTSKDDQTPPTTHTKTHQPCSWQHQNMSGKRQEERKKSTPNGPT